MHEIHIRMKVGAVRLEFQGRRAFFETWIEPLVQAAYAGRRASNGATSAAPAPRRTDLPVFQPSSPAQFRRFASQVGARADAVDQRAMAFAFYLWNFERQNTFKQDDIAAFFRTVQDDPPEDLADLLGDLESRLRFLKTGESAGTFELTSKGVNYVKNRLLGPT